MRSTDTKKQKLQIVRMVMGNTFDPVIKFKFLNHSYIVHLLLNTFLTQGWYQLTIKCSKSITITTFFWVSYMNACSPHRRLLWKNWDPKFLSNLYNHIHIPFSHFFSKYSHLQKHFFPLMQNVSFSNLKMSTIADPSIHFLKSMCHLIFYQFKLSFVSLFTE